MESIKMYNYFETKKAVYSLINGKHYKHLKTWDDIPSMKYHNIVISTYEYVKAFHGID